MKLGTARGSLLQLLLFGVVMKFLGSTVRQEKENTGLGFGKGGNKTCLHIIQLIYIKTSKEFIDIVRNNNSNIGQLKKDF